MPSSSPSDSDVEEAVEGDTVAVGSDPAAVTGETCTRDQHPTSWEDAVDRWANQGDALKPCKASQCWGTCFYQIQFANQADMERWPAKRVFGATHVLRFGAQSTRSKVPPGAPPGGENMAWRVTRRMGRMTTDNSTSRN